MHPALSQVLIVLALCLTQQSKPLSQELEAHCFQQDRLHGGQGLRYVLQVSWDGDRQCACPASQCVCFPRKHAF